VIWPLLLMVARLMAVLKSPYFMVRQLHLLGPAH